MNKESAISYIIHDIDNEWQFLDGEDVDMAHLIIVSVEQVLDNHPDLKEIINDIPEGYCAIKNEANNWIISEIED